MMKDIYESSKPLMEEVKKMVTHFETFRVDEITFFHDGHSASSLEVGHLLRMAIERRELELEAKDDDLLFRMNTLWESVDIIIHKFQYVLEHISRALVDDSSPSNVSSSSISSTTKKSALSESVEVFKQN